MRCPSCWRSSARKIPSVRVTTAIPITRPSSAPTHDIAVWRAAAPPAPASSFDASTIASISCLPTHATAVGNTPPSTLPIASPIVIARLVLHTSAIARLLYLNTPR